MAPVGFSMVYNEHGQALWRCTRTVFVTAYDEYRRCTYAARKSRINAAHECRYDLPAARDRFLKLPPGATNASGGIELFRQTVMSAAAHFVGASAISASVACSVPMQQFLVEISEAAVSLSKRNPQVRGDFEHVIAKLNPDVMKQEIEKAGDEAFEIMRKELEKYGFVNVMIDAATILNMRIVHSTINSPFSGLAPVPFRSVPKIGQEWCEKDYMTEVETALACLQDTGLTPVSICHDRLACQDSAVKHVLAQLGAQNPVYSLIVDVPCLNHMLHNCLINAKNRVSCLRGVIGRISDLAKELRKPEAIMVIGSRCPLYPETRWLYIVDTISFIRRNQSRIRTYLRLQWEKSHTQMNIDEDAYQSAAETASRLPREIFDLYRILKPLKAASLSFECESSRLSDAIPVFQVIFEWYQCLYSRRSLELESSYEVLDEIVTQLIARIEALLPNEAWAAWTLTRPGRHMLRVLNEEAHVFRGPAGDVNECFVENPVAHDIRKHLRDIEQEDLPDPNDQEDVVEFDCERMTLTDSDSDSESSDSCCDDVIAAVDGNDAEGDVSLRNRLAALRSQSLQQKLTFDITSNTYEKSLETIAKFMKVLAPTADYKKAFDLWLFSEMSEYQKLVLNEDDDFDMWREAHKFDELRSISQVGERLVSVGTSESDVERLNSMHRFIVHDRMTNISAENILARLRMRSLAISEKAMQRRLRTSKE